MHTLFDSKQLMTKIRDMGLAFRRVVTLVRSRKSLSGHRASKGGTVADVLRHGRQGLLARMVAMGVAMLVIPRFVNVLGIDGYGVWETLLAATALGVTVQSVLGQAIMWRFASARANGDSRSMQLLASGGLGIALALCVAIVPATWAFRHIVVTALRVQPEFSQQAAFIFPIIVATVCAGVAIEVIGATVAGSQMVGQRSLIQAAALVTASCTMMLGVTAGLGLIGLVLGQVAGVVLNAVLLTRASRRACPTLQLRPSCPSPRLLAELRPLLLFMALSTVVIQARDQVDRLLLAISSSSAAVAEFALATKLNGLVLLAANTICLPCMVACAAVKATHHHTDIPKAIAEVSRLMGVVVGGLAVVLITCRIQVSGLWLGTSGTAVADFILATTPALAIAVMLTGPSTAALQGVGDLRPESKYLIASLSINICTKPMLYHLLGPIGLVLASSLSWATAAIVFAWLLARTHRPEQLSHSTLQTFIPAGIVACLAGECAQVFISPAINGTRSQMFVALALTGSFALAVYFGVVWMLAPRSRTRGDSHEW